MITLGRSWVGPLAERPDADTMAIGDLYYTDDTFESYIVHGDVFSSRSQIGILCTALHHGEPPPLEWVVRWSEGGSEPVDACWNVETDAHGMAWLVEFYESNGQTSKKKWCLIANTPASDEGVFTKNTEAAEKIRRLCPTPPTLEALLEISRKRRAVL